MEIPIQLFYETDGNGINAYLFVPRIGFTQSTEEIGIRNLLYSNLEKIDFGSQGD